MSGSYNGNPNNFPTSLLIPDDADRAAAAKWAAAYEGLADRTMALVAHRASYFPTVADRAFGTWGLRTWNKPVGSLFHHILIKGSGGGGAGGLATTGCGGGGAGELVDIWLPTALVPASLSIRMGRGGDFGYYITGSTPVFTGGTGQSSTVTGTGLSLEALGGYGAGQAPSRWSGTWPPSPLGENIGGIGRGCDLLFYSPAELLVTTEQGLRGGTRFRGAMGGAGEYMGGSTLPQAGGQGEGTSGGLPGTAGASADGSGGWGAGAGGGGGRTRTGSTASGGGGGSGYRWIDEAGDDVKADDGVYIPGAETIWRGGRGAPGLVIIESFRGGFT